MADIAIVHTKTWDETKPAGSRAKSLGDDDIREFKYSERERQEIDHKRYADESAYTDVGTHKKITFTEIQGAKPTAYSNCGYLYLKDVSAVVELFWEDESGNEIQLTTGGKILGDNVQLSNNTYLTAKDAAGTGTVNLIKASASDVPVLPDASELASNAAPTTDVQIPNKKYVDDQITANKVKLGALASKSTNTEYQADTDGEVTIMLEFTAAGGTSTVDLVVDTTASPTTVRQAIYPQDVAALAKHSTSMFVAKDEYWKVNYTVSTGGSTCTIYWRPLS